MMLSHLIVAAAIVLSTIALVPALILFFQALLALWPKKHRFGQIENSQPRTVVLIPAHNEGIRLQRTIRSILKSKTDNLRILVIADNCTDNTAEIARECGADVVERFNKEKVGKAYALGHGVEQLRSDPPEVVIVIDADAAMGGAGPERIASIAKSLRRPVQSLNVIDRRERNENSNSIVSTLGNRLHNVVRPLGYARLGLPCLLMGSGMAFPWDAIEAVGLENDELGEDKQLGIDMAMAGFPPIFCLETKVASHLTEDYAGFVGQRTRWEQGHLLSAVQQIPRMVVQAFRRGQFYLLAIAIDLAVPPIAVTAILWFVAFCAATLAWLVSQALLPLQLTLTAAGLLSAVLGITWFGFARRRVPFRSLLDVPMYVLRKLPIYASLIAKGPQRVWLRSDRSTSK
jgi:cellulose synthase/poly-beta-1,6-N-acetylglucosamine synthase-like glycosyltransferase